MCAGIPWLIAPYPTFSRPLLSCPATLLPPLLQSHPVHIPTPYSLALPPLLSHPVHIPTPTFAEPWEVPGVAVPHCCGQRPQHVGFYGQVERRDRQRDGTVWLRAVRTSWNQRYPRPQAPDH